MSHNELNVRWPWVVVHGNISEPGDVDVVRFTVAQAASMTVRLRPSESLNGVLALLTADAAIRRGKRASGAGRSVTLTVEASPSQEYYVYVNGGDGTSLGEYTLRICTSAQPAPRVVSAVINGGDGERSVVNRLAVRFDSDVEVDLRAIELTHLGINAPDDPDSPVDLTSAIIAYSPDDQTLTLEFTPSLADGFYELRLVSAGFVTCGGTMLDGDGDGVSGPDYTFGFHRFAGDFDGDADVDLADYLIFQGCFNQGAVAGPMPCGSADLDFDGDIDLSDHVRMLTAFTGSTPHPGPGR